MVEAASQRRAQAKARTACAALATVLLVGCGTLPERADPASDAPQTVTLSDPPIGEAASYPQALQLWRSADDVNAWIGAKFQYDTPRAMQLSETRRRNERLRVHSPDTFFAAPSGVCVDLAWFGVETLRVLDPSSAPAYLMIEFEPVAVAGNTLRRHWVASFQRDGGYYVFADSKRPGRIAGPYSNLHEFIVEYARYRGRHSAPSRSRRSTARPRWRRTRGPARARRATARLPGETNAQYGQRLGNAMSSIWDQISGDIVTRFTTALRPRAPMGLIVLDFKAICPTQYRTVTGTADDVPGGRSSWADRNGITMIEVDINMNQDTLMAHEIGH